MTDRYLQDARNAEDIARLQVEVKHMLENMAEMKRSLELMAAKVDTISQTLTEAKGGWRVLMLVGGAAGSIGAGLSWLVTHVKVSP